MLLMATVPVGGLIRILAAVPRAARRIRLIIAVFAAALVDAAVTFWFDASSRLSIF